MLRPVGDSSRLASCTRCFLLEVRAPGSMQSLIWNRYTVGGRCAIVKLKSACGWGSYVLMKQMRPVCNRSIKISGIGYRCYGKWKVVGTGSLAESFIHMRSDEASTTSCGCIWSRACRHIGSFWDQQHHQGQRPGLENRHKGLDSEECWWLHFRLEHHRYRSNTWSLEHVCLYTGYR